jgi:peptidyl-tRNA hydrolase
VYAVVGLGNPGRKYQRTRHNLGFRVVEHLSQKWGAPFSRAHSLFENSLVERDCRTVMLVKPQTFMNRSGEAVRYISDTYGIRSEDWSVIKDPLPGCQDDWISPVRVKARDNGAPEWGKFERLENGKWVDFAPSTSRFGGQA